LSHEIKTKLVLKSPTFYDFRHSGNLFNNKPNLISLHLTFNTKEIVSPVKRLITQYVSGYTYLRGVL